VPTTDRQGHWKFDVGILARAPDCWRRPGDLDPEPLRLTASTASSPTATRTAACCACPRATAISPAPVVPHARPAHRADRVARRRVHLAERPGMQAESSNASTSRTEQKEHLPALAQGRGLDLWSGERQAADRGPHPEVLEMPKTGWYLAGIRSSTWRARVLYSARRRRLLPAAQTAIRANTRPSPTAASRPTAFFPTPDVPAPERDIGRVDTEHRLEAPFRWASPACGSRPSSARAPRPGAPARTATRNAARAVGSAGIDAATTPLEALRGRDALPR